MVLWPHLNIYNLPILMAACFNVGLIAFLYLRHDWQPVHRAFAAWNLALVVWNIGSFGAYCAASASAAITWTRFSSLGIVWIPATFLHLVLILQEKRTLPQRRLLIGAYVLGALLFAMDLLWPGCLVKGADLRFWGWAPIGGPGTAILDPMLAGSSIYSLVLLRSAMRQAYEARRDQLQYVFWATLIAFVGGGVNVLVIHGANVYPLGNLVNCLYSLIVAYAIAEHGLMDLRIVFRKGLVYGILSGGLTMVYVSLVAVLQRLFGHYGMQENVAFYTAAFPVTVILAPTMKSRIEPFVDRTIFHEMQGKASSALKNHDMALMGVLATEMAHELAKPLTHIMNEGSRLSNQANDFSKAGLSRIEKEAQRAAEILDGFALLSPDRPLHKIAVPLEDLLEEALSVLGTTHDSTIRILRNYGQHSPVFVNPGQIVQVFTNVIQNAWQAMRHGGTLILGIEPSADLASPAIQIIIEDTGPGIPPELLEAVFEPFFTTKRMQGGRGVGLTISRAMVERHDGRMQIESPITPDGGTRVRMTLPMAKKETVNGL